MGRLHWFLRRSGEFEMRRFEERTCMRSRLLAGPRGGNQAGPSRDCRCARRDIQAWAADATRCDGRLEGARAESASAKILLRASSEEIGLMRQAKLLRMRRQSAYDSIGLGGLLLASSIAPVVTARACGIGNGG